jgi:6-pyruvoyltetrahydropterin/6-carboxytetrahydropterin synthase
MSFSLRKRFRFEAAHFLPVAPPGHPCRRLHGHSYQVEVTVGGPISPESDWVMDYGELSRAVRPVLEPLDHNLLNAVPGLENPTSEVLAAWLWQRLSPLLPGLQKISVLETSKTRCDYRGPSAGASSGLV